MTTTFDPRAAYNNDWQFLDRICDAVLIPRDADGEDLDLHQDVKCRERDITTSAFSASLGTLGFQSATTVWEVWRTSTNREEPEPGHTLLVEGVKWAIHSVAHIPHGQEFQCLCSRLGSGGENEL